TKIAGSEEPFSAAALIKGCARPEPTCAANWPARSNSCALRSSFLLHSCSKNVARDSQSPEAIEILTDKDRSLPESLVCSKPAKMSFASWSLPSLKRAQLKSSLRESDCSTSSGYVARKEASSEFSFVSDSEWA